MNKLYLGAILATTSAFSTSLVAVAASIPSEHEVAVTASSSRSSVTTFENAAKTETLWDPLQESNLKPIKLVQYWIPATYCQTYVGPTCPMRVAIPIGSPCTCVFPDGALRGVAQ
jgi:hypothetical protein